MSNPITPRRKSPLLFASIVLGISIAFVIAGCGSSSNTPRSGVPGTGQAAQPVEIEGIVSDGPVAGGTLFVFTRDRIQAAVAAASESVDRRAALTSAGPIATLTRDPGSEGRFSLSVPGEHAATFVFIVFDSGGAEDMAFHDTPPNLEAVIVLGFAGTTQRVNLSMHTTLIAQQVRAQLDPDGDGTPILQSAIQAVAQAAEMSVLAALGEDDQGRPLYPNGESPVSAEDDDMIDRASGVIGLLVRMVASVEGITLDEAMAALAADAGDGTIDGIIPANFGPMGDIAAHAAAAHEFRARARGDDLSVHAVGPCSSAAVSMARACKVDLVDNAFEQRAFCADTSDDADRGDCLAEVGSEFDESEEECEAIFEARLDLCESLGDSAHDPAFGPMFMSNFVDPRGIGGAVPPNPWFPLVVGNRWTYEGDGETIVVEVRDEVKLIDGIPCIVVNDVVTEDGVLIEDTDDWFAQDIDGNVWYCGEIALNYESFEGDEPEEPELVDIDGSWKAGRDGAEPGVLLPFAPVPGDVIRQEVLYGEAEDAIEIDSITATETAPGGACAGDCLKTTDFTPLEPDTLESKYYAPGIGLIVEVDEESGDRVELTLFESG